MENEELETIDSTNDETENLDSTNEEIEVEEVEEKEEYSEREKQLYARLKKAEAELKAKPKTEVQAPKVDAKLSTFDMLALQKANIETEEDLNEVVRWADYNKIPVAEALKSNILKATLAEKAEIRNSALAVNTGTGRRANAGAVSEARLMADAQKGIMPESAEDIAKLARMRLGKK